MKPLLVAQGYLGRYFLIADDVDIRGERFKLADSRLTRRTVIDPKGRSRFSKAVVQLVLL
ncbi:hypothetical protein P3T24_005887 [Paraburkholderia sp. GAS33]|jgi:hypothetical protein|uniref:hypothetical protein n=1 Tax=unclassified Paraburkholderia TaxID=2615204 RepID=UPI003D25CF1D